MKSIVQLSRKDSTLALLRLDPSHSKLVFSIGDGKALLRPLETLPMSSPVNTPQTPAMQFQP